MNIKAFTLFEIIITTAIVGIMMLGIVTTNIALQKTTKDAAERYYVTQMTNNTLNRILHNASLAVGWGSIGSDHYSSGIVTGSGQILLNGNVFSPDNSNK